MREKARAIHTRSKKLVNYVDSFPVDLRPYIRHVKDLAADGNCGFKAIAGLVGLIEDEWIQVKRDLLQELLAHVYHYKQLYQVENRVEELIQTSSHYNDHPSVDYWMTTPNMGHLTTSRYILVLYHLSTEQCLTFLPLRFVLVPTASRTELTIGFVNQNHII